MDIKTLTLIEAQKELDALVKSGSFSLKDLNSLANKVSVVDTLANDGAVTHLYSKVDIETIVDLSDANIRVINKTPAAKFLDSQKFKNAVEEAIQSANPDINAIKNPHEKDKKINELAGNYLFGGDTNGTTGPWADASRRFAAETEGKVIAHMGPGAEHRTMVNVELPEIVNNTKVSPIDAKLAPNENMSPEEFERIVNKLAILSEKNINHNDLYLAKQTLQEAQEKIVTPRLAEYEKEMGARLNKLKKELNASQEDLKKFEGNRYEQPRAGGWGELWDNIKTFSTYETRSAEWLEKVSQSIKDMDKAKNSIRINIDAIKIHNTEVEVGIRNIHEEAIKQAQLESPQAAEVIKRAEEQRQTREQAVRDVHKQQTVAAVKEVGKILEEQGKDPAKVSAPQNGTVDGICTGVTHKHAIIETPDNEAIVVRLSERERISQEALLSSKENLRINIRDGAISNVTARPPQNIKRAIGRDMGR